MERGLIQAAVPEAPIDIPLREVLRYMGCPRGTQGELVTLAEAASREISAEAAYRAVYLRLPLRLYEEQADMGWGPVSSKSLHRALTGCTELVLMAATLGPGVDGRIRRASSSSPSLALALQGAGTAAVEEWCDRLCAKLKQELGTEGLRMRPRFSPGYGDFTLSNQRDIFRLLDCPRKIGLTLTESLLMAPSKSVTAVIGLYTGEEVCPPSGCEACDKNCSFRRS